jgi:hypothetical protein
MMRSALIFFIIVFLVALAPVHAQNSIEEECALFVLDVQSQIDTLCPYGDGACYVHAPISFEAVSGSDAVFDSPGARVSVDDIQSLHTGALNLETQEWGVATLDLPLSDDAAARFLMMGDVTLTRTDNNQFNVRTAAAEPVCAGAPNKLMLETPAGLTVDFALNGATISQDENTLIVIDALPYEQMTISVVTGSITISAEDGSQIVLGGQQVSITLGGDTGLVVIAAPGEPIAFDFALIQFLPLHLLIDMVELPAIDRWTPTGVTLEAGQSFVVIASGLVKTIDYMPWAAPGGHTTADCAAAGRGDWDCKCRSLPEWGTCTLDETASMTLMGSIEGGPAFVVGSGGVFTAPTAGELYLGANDNTFTDNVGSYHAIIIPILSEGKSQ